MSVSVVITNLTTAPLTINELYTKLGAAGSTTASVTISRSVAQLDRMEETKAKLFAGQISIVPTTSSDNVDLLSIPIQQHGVSTGFATVATGQVTQAVVFAEPFPATIVPKITLTIDKTSATALRGAAYEDTVTNTGFNIDLVVTTAAGSSPTFSPSATPATVGPYTATVAGAPLGANPITINWTESIQAIGTLTLTTMPTNGSVVVLAGKTYTFLTALANVDGNVLIGVSSATAIANLFAAITLGAGSGTTYAAATSANPSAFALAPVSLTMEAYALTGGTGGNALTSTTTVSGGSWSATTLLGGVAAAAKTAILSGTTTLTGANASRLSAASINRTSGALSITFNARTIGTNNGPDASSLVIGFSANVNWTACY